jgi:uncharacterized membrane protein YuzA (DUF378 family)
MKTLDVAAAVLVILGALNWGLVAVGRVDLVAAMFGMRFGETSPFSLMVYAVIGIAGLYEVVTWKAIQRRWSSRLVPVSTR